MRMKRAIITLLSVFCIFSFAACGSVPAVGNQPVPVQTTPASSSSVATPGQTSLTTTTDCPASGTARPALMPTLALGIDPTIVYAVNSTPGTPSPAAILKRFDTKNAQKTVLLTLQNTSIQNAQLSVDGQWVLFVATKSGSPDRLELIRLDGQEQQTLACGSTLSFVQWSPNEKYIAFEQSIGSVQEIDLLTLAAGTIQTELHQPSTSIAASVHVQTWLDSTHLYLFGLSVDGHRDSIFLLNTNNGAPQDIQHIPALSQTQFISFDSSSDGTHLYIASSDCETMGCLPPGTIISHASTSTSDAQPLLNDAQHSILDVRAATADTLFFIINNSANPSLDQTKNGLWKMKPDGTNLTHLTSTTTYQNTHLNADSQYAWSNLSRDNTSFAYEEDTQGGSTGIEKSALVYAGLYSGYSNTFAQGDTTQALSIVGWTTI